MTQQEIKIQLLKACKNQLESRRKAVDAVLTNIAISLKEETKSSAGDKHETGRAMLQLERENAGKQLAEIEKSELILNRISTEIVEGPVHLGCVVLTTQANYFIAIAAGEIKIEDQIFYAVSTTSPIAKTLMGKEKEEHFEFRGISNSIHLVY